MTRAAMRHCQACGTRLAWDNQNSLCSPCARSRRGVLGPPSVPGDFWEAPEVRAALEEWHIGKVIRAYRCHPFYGPKPLPQDLVAGWLDLTQAQISRIESGPPVTDLDRLTAWAARLGIPQRWLWFRLRKGGTAGTAPPLFAEEAEDEVFAEGGPASACRPGLAGQGGTEALFGLEGSAGTVEAVPTEAKDEHEVERRTLLALLGALAAGEAIPAGVVERVFAGVGHPLGAPVDLAEWERTVCEYPHLMDTRPVGSMIEDLTADVLAVGRHLRRPHPPLVQAGLLRVSAGLSGLLAIQFEDVGQRRAARVGWAAASRAADASGDRDLAVWVRAREAQTASYAGRPEQVVVDLATQAVRLADGAPSIGLARAHAALALVAAKRGDVGTVRSALADATEVTEHGVTGFVGGWGEKNMWWHDAYTRVLISDSQRGPDRALDQALALHPPGTLGPVTNLHLMRALHLVKNREIDEGLNHAVASLRCGDPGGNMRRTLTGQIIDALPGTARTLPAVRELRELTAAPARPRQGPA